MAFKRINLHNGRSRLIINSAGWRVVNGKKKLLVICISKDMFEKTNMDIGDDVYLSHDAENGFLLITKSMRPNRETRRIGSTKKSRNCTRTIKTSYQGEVTEIFSATHGQLILKRATDMDLLFKMEGI